MSRARSSKESDWYEAEQVQRGADHCGIGGKGGRYGDGGFAPASLDKLGTLFHVKTALGGFWVSGAPRLQSLEEGNAPQKRLLADAMLDNAMLKEISAKDF
ncbi:hypothetical protein OKA06_01090 [Novosphingobium sp. MW5]|nr:hypothetical protein [Novosphingobium sp. MW5]